MAKFTCGVLLMIVLFSALFSYSPAKDTHFDKQNSVYKISLYGGLSKPVKEFRARYVKPLNENCNTISFYEYDTNKFMVIGGTFIVEEQ